MCVPKSLPLKHKLSPTVTLTKHAILGRCEGQRARLSGWGLLHVEIPYRYIDMSLVFSLSNEQRPKCAKLLMLIALNHLRFLSNVDRAHLWDEKNVDSVISFALSVVSGDCVVDVVVGALSVLCDIVEHTSIHKFQLEDASSPVLHLCQTWYVCRGQSLNKMTNWSILLFAVCHHL